MRIICELYANRVAILLLIGLILPSFSFAPTPNFVWGFAQKEIITPPQTFKEAEETGRGFLETIPRGLEKIWREEALPIWQKIYNWLKGKIWDSFIGPFFKKEIEKRKPIIKEEFKKEKEELKEEVPKVGKTLWERFKELIK